MNNSLEIEELKKIGKYTSDNIKLIKNNYPIQYIIGYVNFYGYKIFVDENTLIPRYETEYLVEKTINYIKKYNFNNPKVLDLCTGSGCIGLTLKKEIPTSIVYLSDISSKALDVARKNKVNLDVDVNIIESDLFNNIKDNEFDIIISNPPYVMEDEKLPENVKKEPSLALYSGKKGIDHLERIFKEVVKYTKDKYLLAFEINEKSEGDLTVLINKYFSNVNYSFEKDLAGRTRYLFIRSE